MKKILLTIVTLLMAVGAWAQVLNFTFTRDKENATVNVIGADGVTATIAAISPNPQNGITKTGVWNTGGSMATDTNVLCTSTNSKDATKDAPITYTLTINGLEPNQVFNAVTFVSKAVSGGGAYQQANTGNNHYCNFSLTASDNSIETKEQVGIMVKSSAGETKEVAFNTNDVTADPDGELVLTLKIWNHSDNPGCFYGLTEIKVVNYSTLLENLINEAQTLCEAVEGKTDVPGYYTAASVNALKAAIEEAEAKVEAGNVTDADNEELQAAIDALQVVLPNPDKFYVLKCNHENRYIYVNAANKLQWTGTAPTPTEVASNYVWKFVAGSTPNTVKMQSVHTQSYLNTVKNGEQATFGEGVDVTIKKASVVGACVFEAGNAGIGLHAHGNNNTVIGYTNIAGANTYFFEEVKDFSHTLSVTSDWATLVLGFNATIPSGVEVYSVSETSDKSAKLEAVTEVVPANEAVLVKANNGNYTFGYTTTEGNIVDNKLEGTLFTKNVEKNAYVLAKVGDNVGFYSAKLTDGVFQNNANKAYLPADAVPAGARFLSFDFGTETAIEGVEGENGNVKTEIYDLAGRRVKAAQKGLYIVNGKKVIK